MMFRVVSFFQGFRFRRSPGQQSNSGQQFPSPSDLTTELEDSRQFSLSSLTMLFVVLADSGSKALHLVVLTLLIYTISLHLAINTCFLQNYPTLSKIFHVIPLLGTSCMAGVELVSNVKSPALATVGIFLGVFPLVARALHHGRHCVEAPAAGLPVRMQHVPAPAVPSSADTALA